MTDEGIFYENKLTPLTQEYLTYILNEGWKLLFGSYPKKKQLALLWSQTALEGGFKSVHWWNLGNVKRTAGHDFTSFRCSEIINGKEIFFDPPHPQTFFNCYLTPEQGAKEYIEFLSKRKRYAKAWQGVLAGDPVMFVHQLKLANYFTANENLYQIGVNRLVAQFNKIADKILVPGVIPQRPKSIHPAAAPVIPGSSPIALDPTVSNVAPIEDDSIEAILAGVPLIDFRWNDPDHNDINEISPIDLGPVLKVTGIFNIIYKFILDLIAAFKKKK